MDNVPTATCKRRLCANALQPACAPTAHTAPCDPHPPADAGPRRPSAWVRERLPGRAPLPPISRSDEEFRVLGVEFLTSCDGIRVHELTELFEKVGG